MSARLAPPRVPTGRVTVQPPPELTPADGISSLLSSMLPMLGSIGAIVMVTISNAGPIGFLTGGMFLLSSLGFVAVNGWRQRAQRQSSILSARREYLAYLGELRETVRTAAKQQRRAATWSSPAPSALPYLAEERTRVWERRADDPDFLDGRVGTSDQPLCIALDAPELPPLAQLDPVSASAAHRFMLTHEVQSGLPFAIPLRAYARVEVTGTEEQSRALVRALLAHLATMQSPELLQIVIAADSGALPHWEWAKWLPHTHSTVVEDALGPARMIGPDLAELEAMLPADVRERPRFSPDAAVVTPHVIVVTDGVRVGPGDPILGSGGVAGVTVLDLPARWDDLAGAGVARLAVPDSASAPSELVVPGAAPVEFHADALSIAEAEATARRLLPLHTAPVAAEGGSRAPSRQLELVELLGLPDVRDLDLGSAWAPRPERDRLRVPIGQAVDGSPLVLDLKESAQQGMGPHGLIIGATGSGKSEVLRTLVLALALRHSSEALNFLLIDFKGGATFAGMSELPHVSAIVTNLGQELALVDRMQDAMQGEITRRQELLRSAPGGPYANVLDYEKARRGARGDLAPLPALLIVADEFSEMLTAKPEFADTFAQIGRVGRSLQIHLLLATQRLEEGRLRGLEANLSYRIGLRTFTAADSRAVLGVPDAHTLPQDPGHGYLKADAESMTQFRAAYVSGPPPRRRHTEVASGESAPERRVEFFSAAPVLTDDAVEVSAPVAIEETSEPAETRTTFDLAVERMRGQGPAAHRIWLPPLEEPASLDQLMPDLAPHEGRGLFSPAWRTAGAFTIPLGVVDVPLEQRRESLTVTLDGAAGHLVVVGGPRSGKSTLLRTAVAALALTQTPQEAQFYVLDFGGGTFTGLRDLPHLAGLATRAEPDVARRTLAEVTGILDAREAYFRAQGIDSIETYRRRRSEGRADDGYGDVFLVIDGLGLLRGDFEALELAVLALAARGLTYGVHLLLSAARWLEVRPALKDAVQTRLELRLGEASDSEIDRKAAANVPPAAPGRGLSPRRLHMLGALPRIDGSGSPDDLSTGVEDLVARIREAWTGAPGPKLRLLPERITLDEVRRSAPDDRRILLGVDEAGLAPFGIDPAAEPLLYLYGDAGSGKSSVLRSVAHEIMRLYGPKQAKIFLVDYRRALLGEVPDDYLQGNFINREAATEGLRDLATFLSTRIPGPDVTPEQLHDRSWWTGAEGFVLVDDYDLVAVSGGNPLQPIVPLMSQAADVGLHVVVARRAGGASRTAYSDPVIQQMTDTGATGMLLSGNPEEGALIGKVKPAPAIPGRVQVVSRDRGLFAGQIAFVPPRYGASG